MATYYRIDYEDISENVLQYDSLDELLQETTQFYHGTFANEEDYNENRELPNITETYTGLKYAYEKEDIYNTKYTAFCIEHGEEFYSDFYAPLTYNQKQLKEIGQDVAGIWGGECTKVIKNESED